MRLGKSKWRKQQERRHGPGDLGGVLKDQSVVPFGSVLDLQKVPPRQSVKP